MLLVKCKLIYKRNINDDISERNLVTILWYAAVYIDGDFSGDLFIFTWFVWRIRSVLYSGNLQTVHKLVSLVN